MMQHGFCKAQHYWLMILHGNICEKFKLIFFSFWFFWLFLCDLCLWLMYFTFCPLTCEYVHSGGIYGLEFIVCLYFLGSNSWPGTVFNMFVIIGFLMKESLLANGGLFYCCRWKKFLQLSRILNCSITAG